MLVRITQKVDCGIMSLTLRKRLQEEEVDEDDEDEDEEEVEGDIIAAEKRFAGSI